jgi:hypothetical protein
MTPLIMLVVLMMFSPVFVREPISTEAHDDFRFLLASAPISPIVAVITYLFYLKMPMVAVSGLIALVLSTTVAVVILRQKVADPRNVAWRFIIKAAVIGLVWAVLLIAAHLIRPM